MEDDKAAHFQTASRTDRGVHALGNVIAFDTGVAGGAAARALAGLDPRILCRGYAAVPPDFNPRDALGRWYRYFEPLGDHDVDLWRETSQVFVGDHDFAAFSRPDEGVRSTRRRLSSFSVEVEGNLLHLDLRGSAFLWGQVRKIVAALSLVEQGRLTSMEIQQALAGRRKLSLPLAPPERLVLMDVDYAFGFHPVGPLGRAVVQRLEEALLSSWSHQGVLRTFLAAAKSGSEDARAAHSGTRSVRRR